MCRVLIFGVVCKQEGGAESHRENGDYGFENDEIFKANHWEYAIGIHWEAWDDRGAARN